MTKRSTATILNTLEIIGGNPGRMMGPVLLSAIHDMNLATNAEILDVGTGNGIAAMAVALCGYHVTTGEPEGDNWGPWQENVENAGVASLVTFQPFDAAAMPFDDSWFDAIFASGSLHHMADAGAAIRELMRCIKPAGTICILEPTAAGVAMIQQDNADHPPVLDPRDLVDVEPFEWTLKTGEHFDTYYLRMPENER
jgi:ubiquinone/menaquinone biosynthesis C-methylase UbiE